MHPRETAPVHVPWQDLLDLRPWQKGIELTLPLPWLALSWALYASPLWPLGALASFMFFLCALRLNHEAIHGNLGLSRRFDIALLHLLSALMLGCNSSVAWSHMQHHRHAMGPGDLEGHCGHMSARDVLLYGPRFPLDLIRHCWQGGGRKWRLRMLRDGLGVALVLALFVSSGAGFLMLHLAAMAVAQCLTAFFAVWITHQGTARTGQAGRSQRGFLARLAYLMFYHREHHLFPKVPVSRLPDLAARLDAQVPGYAQARQPVVPWLDQAP
ncbi:fatty acid desaturase [Phaeobacter sp. QD34_3]|uniref:fatty acid desaturase n=1 Tax=unclassified Phaeobacter TaxID=2621772 RepID=UPI00237F32F2|nr:MULTISPECIES: fatty acid desaturase [unclassified Phaeobacter]MDE4134242.1 fatty acid desaturase [Phaeobacter sp. QD34_3]MDE4137984.1 fatty acid desaturase [Phaeobacter sp. QD34_24]MDE4174833.1 fatty acid desaturase [Phaeobacter sp. PT47_59]